MRIGRPSHATIVAYLALLVALGGTAVAARDDTGAKELAQFVIREDKGVANSGGAAFAIARCHRREQYVSGGYLWGIGSAVHEIAGAGPTGARLNGPPRRFSVQGRSSIPGDTLTAQAVCLPK